MFDRNLRDLVVAPEQFNSINGCNKDFAEHIQQKCSYKLNMMNIKFRTYPLISALNDIRAQARRAHSRKSIIKTHMYI